MDKLRTIEVMNELLSYLNMNARQLSCALGKERHSWIYEIMNPSRPNGLSRKAVTEICEKWPEVSNSYLLTGEGSLLKSSSISVGGDQTGNINSPGATSSAGLDKLIDVVKAQGEQISALIQQNTNLINIITNLSKQ